MAESVVIVARNRDTRGSRHARGLRKKGIVPGVVYGHKEAAISLALPALELEKAIRHGVRVVDLQAGGKTEKALIRDVQWDHLGKELLHVDFARVAADERIVITVPLEIRGHAPGITAGGVLDQPIHTLSIECLAISVPGSIRVNVGELQLGGIIHVRDLILPPDVKVKADPDAVVVQLVLKQVEPDAVVEPTVTDLSEPEVIGRQKTDEEEPEKPAPRRGT